MSVETPAFMAMCRRMIRAAGKRAGDGDEPELAELVGLLAEVEKAVEAAVEAQRARGVSWAGIALATGTSRQAAHKRWGRAA